MSIYSDCLAENIEINIIYNLFNDPDVEYHMIKWIDDNLSKQIILDNLKELLKNTKTKDNEEYTDSALNIFIRNFY